jgi:hypothetical protein
VALSIIVLNGVIEKAKQDAFTRNLNILHITCLHLLAKVEDLLLISAHQKLDSRSQTLSVARGSSEPLAPVLPPDQTTIAFPVPEFSNGLKHMRFQPAGGARPGR